MRSPASRASFANAPPERPVLSAAVLQELSEAAAHEQTGARSIGRSIDLLRKADLLTEDGATAPARTARTLMRIGAVNLSVGRLWEGHVNALRLIDLYGGPTVRERIRRQIREGAFLGVWGADGADPVTLHAGANRLTGAKCFASGIGTVTHAVVTVNSGPEVRLALINVTDPSRADAATWDMSGMQATASGGYELSGLPLDDVVWVGGPGDYPTEPHFVGGVWRIAALQVGAAAGLLDRAATELRATDRLQAEAQKARLMTVLNRAWAGMALVERAAMASVSEEIPPDDIVATSIAARLFTEELGLDAIRAVEQSIGLRHFATTSETGRMARDLSVYLRQAARDAFLMRAADVALVPDGRIWGVFE